MFNASSTCSVVCRSDVSLSCNRAHAYLQNVLGVARSPKTHRLPATLTRASCKRSSGQTPGLHRLMTWRDGLVVLWCELKATTSSTFYQGTTLYLSVRVLGFVYLFTFLNEVWRNRKPSVCKYGRATVLKVQYISEAARYNPQPLFSFPSVSRCWNARTIIHSVALKDRHPSIVSPSSSWRKKSIAGALMPDSSVGHVLGVP